MSSPVLAALSPAPEPQAPGPVHYQLPYRLRSVPTEPPYLTDPDAGPDSRAGAGEAALPFELTRTRPSAASQHIAPVPRPVPAAAREQAETRAVDAELRRLFGRQRTPRAELPDPRPRAAAAIRMLLEVLAGDRPVRQLAGWLSPRVLTGLENRPPGERRTRPWGATLRSVHVSEPADAIAEVSAVVATGERFRAVAMRLEGLDGRWTVTALRIG